MEWSWYPNMCEKRNQTIIVEPFRLCVAPNVIFLLFLAKYMEPVVVCGFPRNIHVSPLYLTSTPNKHAFGPHIAQQKNRFAASVLS